ncbi:sel1 repeat family protein [Bradyrhizobium sp. ISRA435]|nr:sel1 repeat family protein [Bradyrhizobium sp. ISRA435]
MTRPLFVLFVALVFATAMAHPLLAASLREGVAAVHCQDYQRASRIFIPLAERGSLSAQTYLGLLFETGRGVPQNYTEAAMWYRRAVEQGDSLAQYSLGLLYHRGQACRAISSNGSICRQRPRHPRCARRGSASVMPSPARYPVAKSRRRGCGRWNGPHSGALSDRAGGGGCP